jgi:hypothetical protein
MSQEDSATRHHWAEVLRQACAVVGAAARRRLRARSRRQSVVQFLEAWGESIGLETSSDEGALATTTKETCEASSSNPAVLEPWADLQVDGTPVRIADRFGTDTFEPPQLPDNDGPGVLGELVDPALEPLVRSAWEYRKSQIEAHGDSYWGMFFRTLNQAIHRYGFGIEERHESLESPSERTAGDIADFSQGVSDLAFAAAGVGSVKTPARGATPPAQLPKKLRRPKLRKQTKQAIEDAAEKTPDGKFVDPNTREIIEGKFHYGHTKGKEHRRLAAQAERQGMTQEEFNEWINAHPEWFEIQDRKSNISHRFEKPGND